MLNGNAASSVTESSPGPDKRADAYHLSAPVVLGQGDESNTEMLQFRACRQQIRYHRPPRSSRHVSTSLILRRRLLDMIDNNDGRGPLLFF